VTDIFSHYDPSENRCYVELKLISNLVDTVDTLYDGQTGKVLAYAARSGLADGLNMGEVAGGPHCATPAPQECLSVVQDFIAGKMSDDRKP